MLPPHLRKNKASSDCDFLDDENDFGPKIPEHLVHIPERNREKKSKESRAEGKRSHSSPSEQISVGPKLPPHLQERLNAVEKENDSEESEDEDCYGPALPPGFRTSSSSSDHSVARKARVGPALPPRDRSEKESSFAVSQGKGQ